MTKVLKTNNRVEFLDERYYTDDGIIFHPSVTTILECYPKGWGYKEWLKSTGFNSERIMAEAADKGSKVHDAIETITLGGEILWDGQYTVDEWKMINKYVEFYREHVDNHFLVEKTMVSHNLRAGGTMDLSCEINGERWAIDHKTGNAVYNSHFVQLAAYKTMCEEQGEKIDKAGILWLNARTRGPRKGKIQGEGWQLIEVEDIDKWLDIFHHVREIWDIENPICKPKNLVYPDRLSILTI